MVKKIIWLFQLFQTSFYYKALFGKIGIRSIIVNPLKIDGAKNIEIGNRVYIAYKSWLACLPLTGEKECKLIIGDGCRIGNFNHIYATKSVILERDVLTADKVYISDNLHGYEDVTVPIWKQPIVQKREVFIGQGSWLGENVCVIGANIGKHCIIGANSVVTKDIPDYSVAVGAPAKVIRKFDYDQNKWIDVR